MVLTSIFDHFPEHNSCKGYYIFLNRFFKSKFLRHCKTFYSTLFLHWKRMHLKSAFLMLQHVWNHVPWFQPIFPQFWSKEITCSRHISEKGKKILRPRYFLQKKTCYHGTIMRTGITCKKIPCYMRNSACMWFVVKIAKMFWSYAKHFWILEGVRKCWILIGLCK